MVKIIIIILIISALTFHWSLRDSKSPQVFQYFGRSQQCCSLDNLHSSSPLQSLYLVRQLQLVSPSLSCSIFFSVLLQGLDIYFSLQFPSVLPWGQPERQSPLYSRISFFYWLSLDLIIWPRLGDPIISQNPKEFCAFHFLGRIPGCAYTI